MSSNISTTSFRCCGNSELNKLAYSTYMNVWLYVCTYELITFKQSVDSQKMLMTVVKMNVIVDMKVSKNRIASFKSKFPNSTFQIPNFRIITFNHESRADDMSIKINGN